MRGDVLAAEGLRGPLPASRRAAAASIVAFSHAHPYALYDLEDSCKRRADRQLRNQTARPRKRNPPGSLRLLTLPLGGWPRAD